MESKRQFYLILFSQVFAGMGIGILMGLIIGLSASPVVKTILGSLSGLLAVFLGLQDNIFGKGIKPTEMASPVMLASFRAGSFGLFCSLAILFGLHLRTHDSIGMPVTDQVKRWTDAGYDTTLARELALYEKINLTSKQLLNLHMQQEDSTRGRGQTNAGAGLASTVLFSAENLTNLANLIDPATYDNSATKTLKNYKMLGVVQIDAFAFAVEQYFRPEEKQLEILTAVTELTKVLSSRESEYVTLKKATTRFASINTWAMTNNNREMQRVLTLVEANVPEGNRDEFMKIVTNLLFEINF